MRGKVQRSFDSQLTRDRVKWNVDCIDMYNEDHGDEAYKGPTRGHANSMAIFIHLSKYTIDVMQ